MKSIKLKLVMLYLILVFIVMIVSGSFMLLRIRVQETEKITNDLKDSADKVEKTVVRVTGDFQANLKSSGVGSKIQVNILNDKGKTIASTAVSEGNYQNFVNKSIISAVSGEESSGIGKDEDITGLPKVWIYYAKPTEGINGETYIVFTRTDAQPMLRTLFQIAITFFFTVVLALVLAGVIGFWFADTLTGPIIVLTKKAKEMAQGNLNQEISVKSKDEIGQLTESFNDMAKELNQTMVEMTSEKNKMEIILHNMTDGVLAYGSDGVLIHANFSCHELLNLDDLEKVPFEEMMLYLGVDVSNMDFFHVNSIQDTTIESGDKFISASFTTYPDKYGKTMGIVIVLQDVTKHTKLDNMRKEFVANVSHEIRTPLTTIKSYTETLLDGAIDDRSIAMEFLEIVDSEADRMALLVKDLLELSKFDNKQFNLEMAEINLINILKLCIKQNSILAEKKEQKIILSNEYEEFKIEGDAGRINQVITNVISNAIKYSPEASLIEIFTEETERYYRIYIKDSGIGIPKEDVGRIFERFYRVDKARSRAMGGTGLGLAIAKEIIEAHEGKIFISSEVGKGTTMILRFKKSRPAQKEIEQ